MKMADRIKQAVSADFTVESVCHPGERDRYDHFSRITAYICQSLP